LDYRSWSHVRYAGHLDLVSYTHTYTFQFSLLFAIRLIEIQVLMHKNYEIRIHDMLVPGNSVDVKIITRRYACLLIVLEIVNVNK
jgi:hypothetical protein